MTDPIVEFTKVLINSKAISSYTLGAFKNMITIIL